MEFGTEYSDDETDTKAVDYGLHVEGNVIRSKIDTANDHTASVGKDIVESDVKNLGGN